MSIAVLTCKGSIVTSYEEAEELIVYDMDSRAVKLSLKKPNNIEVLEDLFEEHGYDFWVFITTSIPEYVKDVIEAMGVKVQIVKSGSLREVLEELFIL